MLETMPVWESGRWEQSGKWLDRETRQARETSHGLLITANGEKRKADSATLDLLVNELKYQELTRTLRILSNNAFKSQVREQTQITRAGPHTKSVRDPLKPNAFAPTPCFGHVEVLKPTFTN